MDADLDLAGERALGDYAIKGRAREPGAGQDGRQAKDAVGGIHRDGLPFGDGQWLPLNRIVAMLSPHTSTFKVPRSASRGHGSKDRGTAANG